MTLLHELISAYHSDSSNSELEVRFKDITYDVFKELYTALYTSKKLGTPVYECSVNIISDAISDKKKLLSEVFIRKIVFTTESPIEEYIKKSRTVKPINMQGFLRYTIALSKEQKIKKFPTNVNAKLRFKRRASFTFTPPNNPEITWRLDLTAVKQISLSETGADLKSLKTKLCNGISNFIDFNPVDFTHYELELELIKTTKKLTEADFEITSEIFHLLNPNYISDSLYREELYNVAEYIFSPVSFSSFKSNAKNTFKQMVNQALAFDKNDYYTEIYPPNGYYITDKADGERAIISCGNGICRLLKSTSVVELQPKLAMTSTTIVDCEIVNQTAYIFDVIVYKDENVGKYPFEKRIEFLENASSLINDSNETIKCMPKKYTLLSEQTLEADIISVWEKQHAYKLDGLIITKPGNNYIETKNYKWKPYIHNTIDFLAMRCPPKIIGVPPYNTVHGKILYLLFNGISHYVRNQIGMDLLPFYRQLFINIDISNSYYPIHFAPSNNPLAYLFYSNDDSFNGKIIELFRSEDKQEWVLKGVREDRQVNSNYFGNDFGIAELTYNNYIDPFKIEDLWAKNNSYFNQNKDGMYSAPNKYKRFVISTLLLANLSNSKWIIDAAAGRGADLHRYKEIGVEQALFIDIDPIAISELIKRKYYFYGAKRKQLYTNAITVHTMVKDLKTNYNEIIKDLAQYNLSENIVDGVVCNFALHYFCDTIDNLRNILLFVSKMLKKGGLFMFTVMNGEKVNELLTGITEWESKEGTIIKYRIKKLYDSDKLLSTGQIISVLLPFSNKLYDEPLCNIATVIAEAKKLNMNVELNDSLSTFSSKFAVANKIIHDKLTKEDNKYIELHSVVSLRKMK